jgi:hypothetical protein
MWRAISSASGRLAVPREELEALVLAQVAGPLALGGRLGVLGLGVRRALIGGCLGVGSFRRAIFAPPSARRSVLCWLLVFRVTVKFPLPSPITSKLVCFGWLALAVLRLTAC